MNDRAGEFRGLFRWLVVWLVALWPAACMRYRTAGPDTYIGPSMRPAIARSQSGGHKVPPANAAGVALKPTGAEGPRNTNTPVPGATAGSGDEGPPVSQAAAPRPVAAQGPMRVSIAQAIVMALENNPELAVERLEPRILDTYVEEEQAVFDPLLAAVLGHERVRADDLSSSGVWFSYRTDSIVGEAALTKLFPSGTTVELEASTWVDDASRDGQQLIESRLGMTVSQALMRGAGTAVNLARVREARLDVLASEYEVRGFTEALVALVEQTYWDYALAKRQIEIYEGSIALAEQLFKDTQSRGQAGAAATSDSAAAEAEVALRRQDLVDARSNMARAQALLLGFLNPPRPPRECRPLEFVDALTMSHALPDDVESHIGVGLGMRPELNQARLLVRRGELQVLRTRNGLLPRLDLFATFRKTGYAETVGGSWKSIRGDGYDLLVGLSMEHPLGNHEAGAQHRRAVLSRRQAEHAVENLEQLVEVDVRTAHIEAGRAREKVAAVAATRRLDEEKLRIEAERFRLGQASSFQVARAQRDLVRRQIAEVEAIAEYRKALVELYRLDGSLLRRRGVIAPGAEPVAPGMGKP